MRVSVLGSTLAAMDILNLGERVKVVGEKLAELGRQREALDREATQLLAELKHLGQGLLEAPPSGPVTTWGNLKGALEPATGRTPPAATSAAPPPASPSPPASTPPVERKPALPSLAGPSLKNRVLLVLSEATAPMTKEMIASLIDEPPARVGYCLYDLRKKLGLIDIPRRGMFCLNQFWLREAEKLKARGDAPPETTAATTT